MSRKQRTNVTNACFYCKQRHIKCTGTATCTNCSNRNLRCFFITPNKRRGPKSRWQLLHENHQFFLPTLEQPLLQLPEPLLSNSQMPVQQSVLTIPQLSPLPYSQTLQFPTSPIVPSQ
ncbi:hypothetical protein C2G38_1111155 [Gigaspora rosea]|uniref:Zn(2)-C6 fungal-type domain-containing protein n=1 Tax=Gigaspora rosea TaxID=44941 RepID=A0A397VHM1_9GLOM|nr:hypothetical protein C2G38_1111155 [Gigaspora rosea]